MAKKKDLPNKHYVEQTRQELRRLQHWFSGFKAAGGQLPPCMAVSNLALTDPIHKASRLMDQDIETTGG